MLYQINSLLKMIPPPTLLGELFCGGKNKKVKNDHKSFLRENWFEMSDLLSSLLIFTIIKTILSTFFFTVSNFYKNLVKWALQERQLWIENVAFSISPDLHRVWLHWPFVSKKNMECKWRSRKSTSKIIYGILIHFTIYIWIKQN